MAFLHAFVCTFFVATATASLEPLMCVRYCLDAEYDPVCAVSGQTWKLFNSPCDLANAECSERVKYEPQEMRNCIVNVPAETTTGTYEIIKEHPITPMSPLLLIPRKGTSIEDPVIKINLPIAIAQCDFECIALYDPMCGFDGKSYQTFSNSCEMLRGNCLRGSSFKSVDKSFCAIDGIYLA